MASVCRSLPRPTSCMPLHSLARWSKALGTGSQIRTRGFIPLPAGQRLRYVFPMKEAGRAAHPNPMVIADRSNPFGEKKGIDS